MRGASVAGVQTCALPIATLSGIPAGWTVRDGVAALSNGAAFAAADLGSLVVSAPDQGGESALLTLTVSTAEGGGTSAVEILSVTARERESVPAGKGGDVG